MKRRQFITLLGGAAAAWPVAARAQEPVVPVVGWLSTLSSETPAGAAAVRQGLAEMGFTEGKNLSIDYRPVAGQVDKLPGLAAELVRRRVAVIIAPGSLAGARAAKQATTTIPIVFSFGADPVQLGLVTNLNRPGQNITGFTEMAAELAPKRLAIMHEVMPSATRYALFMEPNAPTDVIGPFQSAASAIGCQTEVRYAAGNVSDIDSALTGLKQTHTDAILVQPNPLFFELREQFAMQSLRHAMPAIYWDRAFADAGGLMSYGSSVVALYRQVGIYAGRILRGEKPGDLPVQRPTKFELVINLKAAKPLGLTMPQNVLALADEVIE